MSAQIASHQEVEALALLKVLHPTPALGGRPKLAALTWLRANEHISRGNYGAPLGWFNARSTSGLYAKLLVGIRAFLYHGSLRRIYLYGGVGIVAESKAEKECQESFVKMTSLIDQITIVKDGNIK
jgi:isochorismate synthase EntC